MDKDTKTNLIGKYNNWKFVNITIGVRLFNLLTKEF